MLLEAGALGESVNILTWAVAIGETDVNLVEALKWPLTNTRY